MEVDVFDYESSASSTSGDSASLQVNGSRDQELGPMSSTPRNLGSNVRHRRYSLHSGSPFPVESLRSDTSMSYCDLALITKKKLLQIGQPHFKSLTEVVEPESRLVPISKQNSADLRREVLLASIQRSLSASSEDLVHLGRGRDESSNSVTTDEEAMEMGPPGSIPLSLNRSMPSLAMQFDDSLMVSEPLPPVVHKPYSPKAKSRRSMSGSYTPMENQNWNSSTTCTSTISMAGSKGHSPLNSSCRSVIKKLNVSPQNVSGCASLVSGLPGSYYNHPSGGTARLGATLTTASSTPHLKKRLHSSSPSKYSSPPYHTLASVVSSKEHGSSIFSSAPSPPQPLSPEWDLAIKRLKVFHNNQEATNEQLNELAQDFHRLKTPFT